MYVAAFLSTEGGSGEDAGAQGMVVVGHWEEEEVHA